MKRPCKAEIEVETIPWGEKGRVDPWEEAIIAVVSPIPERPEKVGR